MAACLTLGFGGVGALPFAHASRLLAGLETRPAETMD